METISSINWLINVSPTGQSWLDLIELPTYLCHQYNGTHHFHTVGDASLTLIKLVNLAVPSDCTRCTRTAEYMGSMHILAELSSFQYIGNMVDRVQKVLQTKKLIYLDLEDLGRNHQYLTQFGSKYAADSLYFQDAGLVFQKDVEETLQKLETFFVSARARKIATRFYRKHSGSTFFKRLRKVDGTTLGTMDSAIVKVSSLPPKFAVLDLMYGTTITDDRSLLRAPAPLLASLIVGYAADCILIKSSGVDPAVLEVAATLWDPTEINPITDGEQLLELAALVFPS